MYSVQMDDALRYAYYAQAEKRGVFDGGEVVEYTHLCMNP
jgi:hypothetical protein